MDNDTQMEDDTPHLDADDSSSSAFIPPSINEPALLAGDSYTYFSPVPELLLPSSSSSLSASPPPPSSGPIDPSLAVPCYLGVDEAGRGPVLGPMVYGVFYAPAAEADALLRGQSDAARADAAAHTAGQVQRFDDSKVLSAATRAELLAAVCRRDSALQRCCGWAVSALSARDIGAGMLGGAGAAKRTADANAAPNASPGPGFGNLNEQALDATVALIRGVLDRGVRVTDVFVDTVGPPATHQKKLERFFPGLRITVAKKADSLYPVVSAASVCAKVTRDVALEVLYRGRAAEGGDAGDASSPAWGSGYPSDGRCTAWLRQNMHPLFGWGPECRFSWGTAKDLLGDDDGSKKPSTGKKGGVRVEWPAPLDDDDNGNGAGTSRLTEFFVASAAGPSQDRGGDEADELGTWFGRPAGLEAF